MLLLLIFLGGVGGCEAKCLCKRSKFLSTCKWLLSSVTLHMADIHQDQHSIKNLQVTFLKSCSLYSFI